jgi:hypothetical protein
MIFLIIHRFEFNDLKRLVMFTDSSLGKKDFFAIEVNAKQKNQKQ